MLEEVVKNFACLKSRISNNIEILKQKRTFIPLKQFEFLCSSPESNCPYIRKYKGLDKPLCAYEIETWP
jgi:hypothetical protein